MPVRVRRHVCRLRRDVRVRGHLRRRIPKAEVSIIPLPETLRPGSLGSTITARGKLIGREPGQSYIHLERHLSQLRSIALAAGIELKEAHIRDDIIETIIHENLHATIAVEVPEAETIPIWKEEDVVHMITKEVMEEIRTVPMLHRRVCHGGEAL